MVEADLREVLAGLNRDKQHEKNQSNDFIRCLIASFLDFVGHFDTESLAYLVQDFCPTISKEGVKTILHRNCENGWIGYWRKEGYFWKLNPKSQLASHEYRRERMLKIMLGVTLNQMVRSGELGRKGRTGKYFKLKD